ncbi:hypothetical protein L2E82_28028 [Cichorium intybus]|uniref:Uncharacterized protein n=1 Tax=Cichorium intybus TaxID=13427 RepID=A0ACB9CUS4_CICIN|nr:hypothetical protein L2E82_28028 [Cichorium intybus]
MVHTTSEANLGIILQMLIKQIRYRSCGYREKSLNLFIEMRRIGNQPDGYTVVGLLSGLTCSSLLEIGQGIHGYCLRSGFDSNSHISSALVSTYSRCGCICNLLLLDRDSPLSSTLEVDDSHLLLELVDSETLESVSAAVSPV